MPKVRTEKDYKLAPKSEGPGMDTPKHEVMTKRMDPRTLDALRMSTPILETNRTASQVDEVTLGPLFYLSSKSQPG